MVQNGDCYDQGWACAVVVTLDSVGSGRRSNQRYAGNEAEALFPAYSFLGNFTKFHSLFSNKSRLLFMEFNILNDLGENRWYFS